MSGPMDVLAVLDELRVGWYGEMSRQTMPPEILGAWMRLDVARAAVADLIEAAQRIADNIIICDTEDGRAVCAALANMRAQS